jgi:hypothetical protein
MRRSSPLGRSVLSGVLASFAVVAGTSACVDPFGGSKIELFLHGGVQVPGNDGAEGRPPSDTHYEMYVVRETSVFKLIEFEIRPAVSRADKCFIEMDGDRFPGLHSTQIASKLIAVASANGRTPSDADAADIALAQVRVGNMGAIEGLKVLTSHEAQLTDGTIATLWQQVPDPSLIADDANAARLAACHQIFAAHPGYYVGTDKILSLPINGTYYGIVEGMDPRNMALLGGASFSVDASFPEFDALRVNWNFNNPNDPRRAGYSPSNIGWHYMSGTPFVRTRGVINVTVRHQDFPQISGDIAIYTGLEDDSVHL